MIGYSKTFQFILAVMTVVFGALLFALQAARTGIAFHRSAEKLSTEERSLWISEIIVVVVLLAVVIANFFIYFRYIPENSPGCLPFISPYGVIASNADPTKFVTQPVTPYPAVTYTEAIAAYRVSPNGFATGYFSWDGLSVLILDSNAHQLSSAGTKGTSWIFQDLNTTTAHSL